MLSDVFGFWLVLASLSIGLRDAVVPAVPASASAAACNHANPLITVTTITVHQACATVVKEAAARLPNTKTQHPKPYCCQGCAVDDYTGKQTWGEGEGSCGPYTLNSETYSFGPGILVFLQFALVHLQVTQPLPAPTHRFPTAHRHTLSSLQHHCMHIAGRVATEVASYAS